MVLAYLLSSILINRVRLDLRRMLDCYKKCKCACRTFFLVPLHLLLLHISGLDSLLYNAHTLLFLYHYILRKH